jgi:hypothetical protein
VPGSVEVGSAQPARDGEDVEVSEGLADGQAAVEQIQLLEPPFPARPSEPDGHLSGRARLPVDKFLDPPEPGVVVVEQLIDARRLSRTSMCGTTASIPTISWVVNTWGRNRPASPGTITASVSAPNRPLS